MTNNSNLPFQLHRQAPAAIPKAPEGSFAGARLPLPARSAANSVAVVIYTRIYPAASVLQALVQAGFRTAERPARDNTAQIVDEMRPSLVVLAVDPRREQDVRLAGGILAKTSAAALALVPAFEPKLAARLLNAGADVCMDDSEMPGLLNAQIGALSRWCRRIGAEEAEGTGAICVGGFEVDSNRQQVFRNETPVALTPVEFRIFEILAVNAGKVCSIADLYREVRGFDSSIFETREWAKTYIRRIRRKLEDDPARPGLIVNVRGFGYLLETGAANAERSQRAA